MKSEKEYQLEEMKGGWIRLGFEFVGFVLLAHAIGWLGALGLGFIFIPFAYQNDLVRNYLRDFTL